MDNKEKENNQFAPLVFIRSYSIILTLLSIINLGFFVLKIFLINNPPDYRSSTLIAIDIALAPIYAFLSIGCLATAILRYKRSSYALFTTKVLSFVLICFIPFGTAAFIYWFGWIRKIEKPLNGLG